MTSPSHPHPLAMAPTVRVMVHVASSNRLAWIEKELAKVDAVVQFSREIDEVVSTLLEGPPPRPQVLVVDFDAIRPVDLMQLHSVREHGWCGWIVGLGIVPPALRASLGVERVLNTPFHTDQLRNAIGEIGIGFDAETMVIPVVHDDAEPASAVRARHTKVAVARSRTR